MFLLLLPLVIGIIGIGVVTNPGLLKYTGVPRPPRKLLSASAASSIPFSNGASFSKGTSFSIGTSCGNGAPLSNGAYLSNDTSFSLYAIISPLRMFASFESASMRRHAFIASAQCFANYFAPNIVFVDDDIDEENDDDDDDDDDKCR